MDVRYASVPMMTRAPQATTEVNAEVRSLAKAIWRYNAVREPLKKSDCIMLLGNHDSRTAEYAAKMYLDGWANWLVLSGGLSSFTATIYDKAEALVFREIAVAAGVPLNRIIVEDQSTNTGENFRFTAELLKKLQLNFQSFIFVQKPNMLRRVRATAMKLWPEKSFLTSSHDLEYEHAPHHPITEEMLVHEIVGDLQRVKLYPERGFQAPQEIPPEVWAAFERLVELGFTGNLAK
jgi:uncharacterized SAM-binding protein YcdF (DUF218 family)